MVQAELAQRHAVISDFVDSLHEPHTPYLSPQRLSKAIGVKIADVADLTGLHRNALRNPSTERLQARMREIVEVICAVIELNGDLGKAIYWYLNEPISAYGHRTAGELVAGGQVEAVLAYLRDLENGALG